MPGAILAHGPYLISEEGDKRRSGLARATAAFATGRWSLQTVVRRLDHPLDADDRKNHDRCGRLRSRNLPLARPFCAPRSRESNHGTHRLRPHREPL